MHYSDAYTPIYHRLMFPAWELLRGRPTPRLLALLERTQWLSTRQLKARQEKELRELLTHARARVPAYQRTLEEAGVDPARATLADLARLPTITRVSVQAAEPDYLAAGWRERLLTKSTSGTTGNPFRFRYNLESEVWRQAVKLRAYAWGGWVPGARTLHYWGPPAASPKGMKARKVALDRALRREVYLDCALQGEADLEAAVATIRRLRPQVLVGFTQATVQLARYVIDRKRRDWPAMNVLCGAERLFEHDRPLLEEAFSRPGGVFETYGCREFMLIGSECEAHTGLHLSMENLIVEIVDDAGQPVAPGVVGQVAVTDLHNYAMPLLRYVTGDLAKAVDEGDRCPCGRGLGRIAALEGRQQDLLRGHDGRRVPGLVVNAVFANLGGQVQQFQLVQRRDDRLELKLVPGPEYNDAVRAGLLSRLRTYFGDLPLRLEVVPEIPPLPSGKRRYVIVEEPAAAGGPS